VGCIDANDLEDCDFLPSPGLKNGGCMVGASDACGIVIAGSATAYFTAFGGDTGRELGSAISNL
jgi:hypothetical protein